MDPLRIEVPRGAVVVLNDGETYTGAPGCKVMLPNPDAVDDEIDAAVKDGDGEVLFEFV